VESISRGKSKEGLDMPDIKKPSPKVVSPGTWEAALDQLLIKEKEPPVCWHQPET